MSDRSTLLLTGFSAGLCAVLYTTAGPQAPRAGPAPVVPAVAIRAPAPRTAPACDALRRSSPQVLEAIARERIRTISALLAATQQTSVLDQTLLGLEGALLECLLAGNLLAEASLDDEPGRVPAGIEWSAPGAIAAFTYVLVHDGCAIGIHVQRARAATVFEVWEALLEEQASPAPRLGSAAGRDDATPTHTEDLAISPTAIGFKDRQPGSECWWEVVVSSRQAQQMTVVPPDGTDRLQTCRLLRGDTRRSWLVRGRIVAPGPGRVRQGVCEVRTWPDGQSRDVSIQCTTTSALRPADRCVPCSRGQAGVWHGKLDFDWLGAGAMPALAITVHDVSGIRVTWETIQIAPQRFRLLLQCASDGTGRAPACRLALQVPGEDVQQAIHVSLP